MTTQAQPAAQSNFNEPLFKPIDSDPGHNLSNYRIACRIDSVYYSQSEERKESYGNVLLDVSFDLTDAMLRFADLPVHVLGVNTLDTLPNFGEVINLPSRRQAVRLWRLARSQMNHYDLSWQFCTPDSNAFPPSVKIMLTAVKIGSPAPSIPFSFTVQIRPTLEVVIKRRSWWRLWTNTFRPEKGHRGWGCDIETDYFPHIAKNIVAEYQKPAKERRLSRCVGLRTAMISYFK